MAINSWRVHINTRHEERIMDSELRKHEFKFWDAVEREFKKLPEGFDHRSRVAQVFKRNGYLKFPRAQRKIMHQSILNVLT